MKMLKVASLVALCGAGSTAGAVDMNIALEFKPDSVNPGANRFVNKTTPTGYCVLNPARCADLNISSLITPITTGMISIDPMVPGIDRAGVQVSNEVKPVTLTGPDGSSFTLNFALTHYGGTYVVVPSAREITNSSISDGHLALWLAGAWHTVLGCGSMNYGNYSAERFSFFWSNPNGDFCGGRSNFPIPSFSYSALQVGYHLTPPNPQTMANGTYTGSVAYTVGPLGEINFGDRLSTNHTVLTFNFTVEVKHALSIRFPAGADRLTLNPAGGWRPWLASGRVPDKLSAHQDFRIGSSGPFKMQLSCECLAGDNCAIENKDGDRVPVTTGVTLPSGLSGPNGPVKEALLSEAESLDISSTEYVDNGRARLHFEVDKAGVEQMTGHAGTQYSGNVTVIWDSRI